MLRLAPRIGVSLLVTLLFGPLSSTAHDSDDKSFEGTWSVIVAGHITWTGEDHRDCVHRATETSGQCVRMHPEQGASNQYCPEVTPGLQAPSAGTGNWAHCLLRPARTPRTEDDSDR
jgi:hypothetical protein